MILTDQALVMPDRVANQLEKHFGMSLRWQRMQTTGTRHNLFCAEYDGRRYIARVAPDAIVPPGVDAFREASVLVRIAELEGALQVELVAPECGLLLMPDLGKTRDPSTFSGYDFKEIVHFINNLHRIHDVISIGYPSLFQCYRDHFACSSPGLVQLVDETEAALADLPDIGSALVHHDLHSANLLWDPALHVIDWEYAGLGNPWLDYATLTRDLGLHEGQLRDFDRLSALSDSELQHGLALAIQVVDQLEAIWQHYIALAQPN